MTVTLSVVSEVKLHTYQVPKQELFVTLVFHEGVLIHQTESGMNMTAQQIAEDWVRQKFELATNVTERLNELHDIRDRVSRVYDGIYDLASEVDGISSDAGEITREADDVLSDLTNYIDEVAK